MKRFSKNFQFSLASRAHTFSCPSLPLPKPPFSSSILHQSSRKCLSFLLFSMYFKFLALVFLDFVYMLRYGNVVVEYVFVDVLKSLIHGFCWFCWYNAYSTCLHVCFSFLYSVLCFVLCCAYHVHDKKSLRCFYVSLWIH